MNGRIQQLAEQAGLRFTQLMSNPMVPVVDGKETDLAKFAELIVKECQHRVEQYINECGEVASMPESVIMKHFGVEESGIDQQLRNRSTYFGNNP